MPSSIPAMTGTAALVPRNALRRTTSAVAGPGTIARTATAAMNVASSGVLTLAIIPSRARQPRSVFPTVPPHPAAALVVGRLPATEWGLRSSERADDDRRPRGLSRRGRALRRRRCPGSRSRAGAAPPSRVGAEVRPRARRTCLLPLRTARPGRGGLRTPDRARPERRVRPLRDGPDTRAPEPPRRGRGVLPDRRRDGPQGRLRPGAQPGECAPPPVSVPPGAPPEAAVKRPVTGTDRH